MVPSKVPLKYNQVTEASLSLLLNPGVNLLCLLVPLQASPHVLLPIHISYRRLHYQKHEEKFSSDLLLSWC